MIVIYPLHTSIHLLHNKGQGELKFGRAFITISHMVGKLKFRHPTEFYARIYFSENATQRQNELSGK